ncbi:MAG: CinA family nicotinamide mononucleotide deamidase-related protein [Niabella sp.]
MNDVNASVITIGDELLIGQTIDTNSAYISKAFNNIGLWVKRRVAVGDDYNDIWNALDEESEQTQIIIITGGLGPTADDITKPLLCEYFGGKMVLNNDVLKHIEHLFANVFRHKTPLLERNRKQAEVPDVCTVLHNEKGTAPGMWFEKINKQGQLCIFVSLPGVPYEMKWLLQHEVIPRLHSQFHFPVVLHKTIVTYGLGESSVAELLLPFEKGLPPHIKLAYLPDFGMVKLRLTATGADENSLQQQLNALTKEMFVVVKDITIATDDLPMEEIVGTLLLKQKKTVATAESCTGGNIAHLITKVPGSSAYFKGTVVAYANEVKEQLLNVQPATLLTEGAVSEATVIEMVQGTLKGLQTDYALATSGIMGPGGGSVNKPVGTVWLAVGNYQKIATRLLNLRFDRERNIEVASVQALNFLRKFIVENG